MVAPMLDTPADKAVVMPAPLTDATSEALLDHAIDLPLSTEPAAFLATAVNCLVPPTDELTVAGDTVTVATDVSGGGGGGAGSSHEPAPPCPSPTPGKGAHP